MRVALSATQFSSEPWVGWGGGGETTALPSGKMACAMCWHKSATAIPSNIALTTAEASEKLAVPAAVIIVRPAVKNVAAAL